MSDSHGAAEWRRRGKGCGCLLLIFVLVPLLLLKVCQKLDEHPTDRAMIEEFNSNRSTFESLLNMVRAEKRVSRVADDFIWIDDAMSVNEVEQPRYLPRERLIRYRALFRKLNLESGVVRRADGTIGFLRSSSGMVTSGSGKEFIWSQNVITSALKPADRRSLEDACVPKGGCSVIRRIAPEWYIAFDSD
ncbi:MAG: hypothetical protein EOO77_45435 [Oxalobacteraceae bacterium]|nr:MAG: hypothetical protein EOO77_45435 [Oxalobacteraceae bacterium]